MKKGTLRCSFVLRPRFFLAMLILTLLFFIVPGLVCAADRLVVKNDGGEYVFNVKDSGQITSRGQTFPVSKIQRYVTFTTSGRGVAAFEAVSTGNMQDGFGPSFEFWISDNGYTATKGIVTLEALRDGGDQSGKFEILTANGGTLNYRMTVRSSGYVGIGTRNPSYPLQMASGAYCSLGGVWTNASSREYKKDIKSLTTDEAMDTLNGLNPVKFAYKAEPDERHVGFIAEDAPELVATKEKRGMSSMDVVAVLTKVVQEQQKTITELSRKMSELQRELKLKNDVAMVNTDLPLSSVK